MRKRGGSIDRGHQNVELGSLRGAREGQANRVEQAPALRAGSLPYLRRGGPKPVTINERTRGVQHVRERAHHSARVRLAKLPPHPIVGEDS